MTIQAQMLMSTGSYVGDGTDNRAITGLGGQPDVVILKQDSTTLPLIRTSTMTGDVTKPITGGALQADRIQSLDVDGFTVGTIANVNLSTFYYIAFKAAAGELAVASYTGDGLDDRSITVATDFQPGYVIVIPGNNQGSVQRFAAMIGDTSVQFNASNPAANLIQAFEANGFQVGTGAQVNSATVTYHYVAWKTTAGRISGSSYVGDGVDNRNITGAGFTPKYIIIKADTAGTAQAGAHKSDDPALTTNTLAFTNIANFSSGILALQSDGFQVGTDARVNAAGTTYFWMAFGAADNSLPVELASFTTKVSEGKVVLRWATASESQNLGFNVYRSTSPDGPFTKLNPQVIPGLGTSGTGQEYRWEDDSVDASVDTYYYYLKDVSLSGVENLSSLIKVDVKRQLAGPKEPALLQNYPNAFNPETWMPFQLSEAASVTLNIYDVAGKLVRTLELGQKLPGYYLDKSNAAYWDGRNSNGERMGSGVYFYSIRAGDFTAVRRMVLQK
jgi:hypothetical protein